MILPRGCRCSSGGARPAGKDQSPSSWSVSGAFSATWVVAERLMGRVESVGCGNEQKCGDLAMQEKRWMKLAILAANRAWLASQDVEFIIKWNPRRQNQEAWLKRAENEAE